MITRKYTTEENKQLTFMNGAMDWAKICNTEARVCTGSAQDTASDY